MSDQPIASFIRGNKPLRDLGRVLRGQSTVEVVVRPKSHQLVRFDYPVEPEARYGYGKPPHQELYRILDRHREAYAATLRGFVGLKDSLRQISVEMTVSPEEPYWNNCWFEGLDLISLYGFLVEARPRRYVEVGSGCSTKLARRAIRDHRLPTTIMSIDPSPRAEVDALCDRVVRAPLERAELSLFEDLEEGDVLFLDGSHRCLMNSDATVALLEVLPRLKRGVIVHVHDIFLPYDYPPEWAGRFYSEQYLLAAWLLAEGDRIDVLLPNAFVVNDSRLARELDPLWDDDDLVRVRQKLAGQSFWLSIR